MGRVIGDIRGELERDMKQKLMSIIDKKQQDSNYYILVTVRSERNAVLTKCICMHQMPPKLLGTMCYRVDNQRGELVRLWCLPLDVPVAQCQLDNEAVVVETFEGSRDMPILH